MDWRSHVPIVCMDLRSTLIKEKSLLTVFCWTCIITYTVVSQKSAHLLLCSNFQYRVKVYFKECPPWSELCVANQSALVEC